MNMTDRNARVALVLEMLQTGDLIPAWKLGRAAGVKLRSVHRYINLLRSEGYDIGGCTGYGGGLMLRKRRQK